MRKLLFLIVAMFLMTTVQVSAASDEIKIKVNKMDLEIWDSNQKPYVNKDNRVMIPVRPVVTALGIPDDGIKWDQETKTATVTNFVNEVQITLGKDEVLVNGEPQKMDTAAEIKHGNIFLPARYLIEGLGYDVGWDQENRRVIIESYVDFTMIPNYLSEEDKQHYYDIQKYGTNLERFWGVPTEKVKIPYELNLGAGLIAHIDKIVVFDSAKKKGPFTEIFTDLMSSRDRLTGKEYDDKYYTVALHIDIKNPNYQNHDSGYVLIRQRLFAGFGYENASSQNIHNAVNKNTGVIHLTEPETSIWYLMVVEKDTIDHGERSDRLKRVLIKPGGGDSVELAEK